MAPTLLPGDFVVALPRRHPPQRGEIVIFEHPHQAGFEMVKRIVGLPGEEIVIANGQVHADTEVLAEPWADGPTHPDGAWILDRDEVFLLGDNRSRSAGDSRWIGPVALEGVRWAIVWRYWPLGSIGRVGL